MLYCPRKSHDPAARRPPDDAHAVRHGRADRGLRARVPVVGVAAAGCLGAGPLRLRHGPGGAVRRARAGAGGGRRLRLALINSLQNALRHF